MHSYGDTDDDGGPSDDGRRWGPPDNEVPQPVALSAVLARTGDVAVAITGVQAYTTGVAFTLAVRLRHDRVLPGRRDLHDLVGGWHGPAEDQLMLGVEFSDGRATSTSGAGRPPSPGSGLDEPVLTQSGGGGGSRNHDQDYWLSPVPPPGTLTVVLVCQGLGLEETVTELDAGALVQAAAGAQVLWEHVPEEPPSFEEPPVPDGGWFGRLRRPAEPDAE